MVPDESPDPFAEAVRVMREQERVHEEPPAAAPESPIVHPDTPVIPKTKPGILTRLSGIAGLLRGKTRPEITETARQEPEVPEGAGDVAGAGAFSESAEPMPAGEDQPPGEIVPASPMEGEPAAGEDHEAPGPAVAPEPPLSAEEAPSSGTGAGIPAGGAGEDLQVPEVPPAGVDAEPPDGPHVRPVLPAAPIVLALCATAAIILILIIGGIGSHQPGPGPSPAIPPTAGTPQTPGTTPATPTPMLTQAPTPATVPGPVPGEGVWVRVTCNGSFVGYVGNPGALRHVGGSGEQLYGITDRGGLVQASFTKQEYSGETLSVTVYRDGAAIFTRSVRAPGGSLDFIIDPATGGFPGGIPTPTSATGLTPGKTY